MEERLGAQELLVANVQRHLLALVVILVRLEVLLRRLVKLVVLLHHLLQRGVAVHACVVVSQQGVSSWGQRVVRATAAAFTNRSPSHAGRLAWTRQVSRAPCGPLASAPQSG